MASPPPLRRTVQPRLALAALFVGCTDPWPGGPTPLLAGEGFFDAPWPSDTRLVDGSPDLTGFPFRDDIPLIEDICAEAELLDGFGTNSPLTLRFTGPVDPRDLPSPGGSLVPSEGLFLVDIDPRSPERGRRLPLELRVQEEGTDWQPEDLLVAKPLWGQPLRSSTRYALVLTRERWGMPELADGSAFGEVFDPDHPRFPDFADLADTLFALDVDTSAVAFASVFTTQDTMGEMARIVDRMKTELPTDVFEPDVTYWWGNERFQVYQGQVRVPIWQRGQAPYASDGGGFVFDDSGSPLLATLLPVRFTLSVPRGAAPQGGWPLVIYAHGTGGSDRTFANSTALREPAGVLADRGIAGLGISQPFHGDRYTSGQVDLLSFNVLNPESGRAALRQASLEQIWLAHVVSTNGLVLHGPSVDLAFDADRLGYLGHSQGGQVGITALPFFGDSVRASVLSGAGGGLALSLVSRESFTFDIQQVLRQALRLEATEALGSDHPAMGLIQMVAEATEPLNYTRHWHAERPPFEASPQNVLLIHGFEDTATPPATVAALAAAVQMPYFGGSVGSYPVQDFVQTPGGRLPAQGNRTGWDGSPVTLGVLQFPEDDHFAMFDNDDAVAAYGEFLRSALAGDQPAVPSVP